MKKRPTFDQFLALIPSIVLLLVAGSAFWRWAHEPFSSWRAGSFGMYADLLDGRGRVLDISVQGQTWERVKLGNLYDSQTTEALFNPTPARIASLAAYLACHPSFLKGHPGLKQVRVKYLELHFNAADFMAQLQPVQEASHAACTVD